jgi:protein involved in polysaccharide export with SLBB domain
MKIINNIHRSKINLIIVLISFLCLSCGTSKPAITPAQMQSDPLLITPVFAPGDVVEIRFLYNAELDDSPRIRPDGNIVLPLVGEVKAAGKSANQLQQELVKLYTPELKKPSITVTARALRNNKVYVQGEVNKPGEVEMPGSMSALEAISQAGGFKINTADIRSVSVVRTRGGRHYGTALNFKEALKGQETEPFMLQPGDVVFVPPTGIAKANNWIDQHISRMLPKVPVSLSP